MSEQMTAQVGDVVMLVEIGCVGEVREVTEKDGEPGYRVDLGTEEMFWPASSTVPVECVLKPERIRAFIERLRQPDVVLGRELFYDEVTGISDAVGQMLRDAGVSPYRIIEQDYNVDRAMLSHYGLRPTQLARLCEINDQASDDERKAKVIAYLEELLAVSGGAA